MPAVRGVGIVIAVAAVVVARAAAAAAPTVQTDRGCYLVGQSVSFNGSGFAPQRSYDTSIDGVDFGQSQTDSSGAFHAHLVPGGLPAGSPQSVEELEVTDGSSDASTTFTVTRAAGARFLASHGNPRTLRASFQVWGFSLDGSPHAVYMHYVSPGGQLRDTVPLGRTSGQCGYLLTPRMRFFPFSPSTGRWTLQADPQPRYSSQARGPVARIYVQIARG